VAEIPEAVARPATSHAPMQPVPAAPHDQGLLSVPAVRSLWIALSLSTLGDWLGLLAATALAVALASSSYVAAGIALALVFALRLVPPMLLESVAAVVSDRIGRRWTMVAADAVRCALFVSIPVVGRLWWLFVATFLGAVAGTLVAAAQRATMARLVPADLLDDADRLGRVTWYVCALVAGVFFALLALLAGVLGAGIPFFLTGGVDLALYVTAATFLFAAVAAVSVPPGGSRVSWRDQPGGGWQVEPLTAALLSAIIPAAALIGAARLYVADLGGGNAAYGALVAAVFAGLALGIAAGPRMLPRLSRRRLLGLICVLASAILVLLALVPNVVFLVLGAFAVGFLAGVAWTTGQALLAPARSVLPVALVAVVVVVPLLAGAIGAHRFTLTDAVVVDYNGAAIALGVVGLMTLAAGALTHKRIDDRAGESLVRDLRSALRGRPVRPTGASLGGYLIAFEGGEGAGKSSQAERLASFLIDRGHDVVLTFEPGSTPVGRMLRMTLLDPSREGPSDRAEALLYAADRADHVDNIVRPALQRGAIVITDRYSDSSVAYQGAGRALPAEDIAYLSEWATSGLVPDVTVLLDVAPEIGLARRGTELDRLESEPADFHDRVRSEFLALASHHPDRYVVIDASLPIEEAAVRIRQSLQDRVPLSARERQEIEERWRRQGDERAQAEQEERRQAELAAERQRIEAEEARQRGEAEAKVLAEERQRRAAEETLRLSGDDEDRQQRMAETDASRQRLSDSEIRRRVAREEAFRYLYADSYDNSSGSPVRRQDADLADEIFGTPEPGDSRQSEGRHRAAPPDDADEEHTQLLPRIDP
jgi:dTMP kinase